MPETDFNIGIYFIRSTISNKYYVGSSINIKKRIITHFWTLKNKRSHSPKLQNAYNKYGHSFFEHGILENCNKDQLKDTEHYWINKLNSVNNGFNCSNDTVCSTRGRKLSTKECETISNRNIQRWANDDGTLLNIMRENAKIATDKRRGSVNSENHNKAISNANKGRKMTESNRLLHKERMSKNPINYWSGKKRSIEDREKMSKSHLGKVSKTKPIIQYDLHMNEVARYNSTKEAASILNIGRTSIKNNLRGQTKICNKKIFKYATL